MADNERDRAEMQAAFEAALRADRQARKEARDQKWGNWGGLLIAFVLIGIPLIVLGIQYVDSGDDHFINCGGLTYTGDPDDYPECEDGGPIP